MLLNQVIKHIVGQIKINYFIVKIILQVVKLDLQKKQEEHWLQLVQEIILML